MIEFNLKKLVQIVSYLLNKNDGKMNYTKLIKLLYISDKKCLENYDYTITGDSYSSMKNGPILSNLFDLIKNRFYIDSDQNYWDNNFEINNYNISLINNYRNNISKLSKAETDILDETYAKYKDYTWQQMIDDVLHDKKNFPEVKWDTVGLSSERIEITSILKSLGQSDEEISQFINECSSLSENDNLFTDCHN